MSAGFDNGNTARIVLNDVDILENPSRGINVIALAGQNHEVIATKSYDTHGDPNASQQLVEDAAQAPPGTVVIAVVKDSAHKNLSQAAKDIFIGMGATEISSLGSREGWLFMGVTGSKQHVEKRGGEVAAGMILGYARVERTTTRTKTATKTYKKVVTRVVKKTITETKNGVTTKRIVTRVEKRTITCKSTKTTKTTTKTV